MLRHKSSPGSGKSEICLSGLRDRDPGGEELFPVPENSYIEEISKRAGIARPLFVFRQKMHQMI